MSKTIHVGLAGGGSGGHVYPLLAVVESLKAEAEKKQLELVFDYLGPDDPYAEIIKSAGISTHFISGGKWRRYSSLQNFLDIFRFFWSCLGALVKLFVIMPDVLFSKGGTGSLPVVLAAWFYHIPIIIHESDSSPGLGNVIAARFSKKIALSFDTARNYFPQKKVLTTGGLVRPSLLRNLYNKKTAKEELGFAPSEPLLLVLGGSQGSQAINNFILVMIPELIKVTQVLHQTAARNYLDVQKLSQAALMDMSVESSKRYEPVAYLDEPDLQKALTAADIVVSRSGSGSIFEIAAFGKPAILIPLPRSARDHQRSNAYEFAKRGGGVVIEEDNLIPDIFIAQIKEILDPVENEKMSKAAEAFFRQGAAELLAQEILKLAKVS